MKKIDFKSVSVSTVKEVEKCPHCGSIHFRKEGHYNGRQKYLCKECNRKFTITTGSITHSIKKVETFKRFVNYMNRNIGDYKTIEILCKKFKLSTQTIFDWRHKYLSSINTEGITFTKHVEADDVNLRFSEKGRKNKKDSRKRGGINKRGDHDELSKVLVSIDSKDNIDMKLIKIGRVATIDLTSYYVNRLIKVKEFETDEHKSFKSMAKELKLNHTAINSKEHPCNKLNSYARTIKYVINMKLKVSRQNTFKTILIGL